jgi:hypothetical protein
MAPPFSHLRCEQRRVTCVDGSIGDFAVFKAPTQNLGHRAPGLALWLFLAEPRRCAWGRAGLSLRASRPPRGILRRYRRLAYFHPLLSAFAESVVRKWPNDSVFLLCYCFMDRPKTRTARFRVSSWSNQSLQANRRSILPASNRTRTGDTMIKTNTLSMAVFALLVNSTVLLSLSM